MTRNYNGPVEKYGAEFAKQFDEFKISLADEADVLDLIAGRLASASPTDRKALSGQYLALQGGIDGLQASVTNYNAKLARLAMTVKMLGGIVR